MSFLERTGKSVTGFFDLPLNMSAMFCEAIRTTWSERGRGDRLVFDVILRQILFTGVEAMKVITVIALLLGFVTIVQVTTQLPRVGGESYIGTMLVLVVVRELGPLITAFIIIGRSGTAVSTEIGNMMINSEISALEAMGINPLRFIVLPRLIGITVAVACLSLYFNLVSLFGGFFFSRLFIDYPLGSYINDLGKALGFWDVAVSTLKCLLFGLIVAVVCCYRGFSVKFSSTEVPQVTTRAVVASILFCFLMNALITALFYI